MNRQQFIEQLEEVQYNIETVERQLNEKYEDTFYSKLFGSGQRDFELNREIRTKALAYWKRRFNRILNELNY